MHFERIPPDYMQASTNAPRPTDNQLRLICKAVGHRIAVDSSIGPDSGSETLYCLRCGWSHDINYY
jgi:hypothetical protein